jgi:RNA-directed DNA polymerase
VTIKVAPKKLITFKQRIKELTGRSRGISMKRRLTDLARYLRGWVGYFGLARQFEDIANLDGWLRRRIRMCYWKQWRHPRTKVKNLVALGVSLDMAIKHAISRKKYWRMSRTPALRYAMPNKWLHATRLGLIKATLVRASFSSWNRLVRTRMLGGVGAAVSNGGGYPIPG